MKRLAIATALALIFKLKLGCRKCKRILIDPRQMKVKDGDNQIRAQIFHFQLFEKEHDKS
jgi:hypothetical protein